MKKMISIITSVSMLLSLASCSKLAEKPSSEKKPDTTSVLTTEAQTTFASTTIEATTAKETIKTLKEIKIDNLDNTYDCDYYSFKYPKEWELKVNKNDPYFPRLIINDEAYFSIGAQNNKYFTESFDRKPTNEDYIDYMASHYGYYDKYVPEGSIGFAATEENNEFYHSMIYRFYNYDIPFEIWFETEPMSDYFYPQETIDKILLSFTLHEVSEPFFYPEKAQPSTTAQPQTSAQTVLPSFSGHGDAVTDVFSANGCTRIKGEYTGDSTFVVDLYDSEGNLESYVFSNLGVYSGQKVFKFEGNKQYMFEVTARDGDWSITVE